MMLEKKTTPIDPKIVELLWDNMRGLEEGIEKEMNKSSYILGFEATVLFVVSAKIGTTLDTPLKVMLIVFFLCTIMLSLYGMMGEGKVKQIDALQLKTYDYTFIYGELKKHYHVAKDLFFKKLWINRINMIFLVLFLVVILYILLFLNK